jgi:hypothetical protein
MPRFFQCFLAFVAATTLALAQTPRNSCSDCKAVGFVACKSKDCKAALQCGIKIEHKCDALYGAKCCRGTQKILCPKCKDPILQAEQDAELESRAAWVASMRKIDEECQTRFSHIETAHWYVHWSIPEWKVGEALLSRTRAAHLYAERIETATARLEEVLGALPAQKQTAYMLSSGDEKMRTSLVKQGVGQRDMTFKTLSDACLFTTRPRRATGASEDDTSDDKGFHQHVIHTATHSIGHATHGQKFSLDCAPWFMEALAHFMEMEIFKRQATFCFREVSNNKDRWRDGDWKKMILSEATARKDPPFAQLITYRDDKLGPRDKAFCWSFLDFLIKAKPAEFKVFFKELKDTNDTKKALDKGYGWSTAVFQDQWRDYVIKTYAP